MNENFIGKVHRIGIVFLSLAIIANFIPVMYLGLVHGYMPGFKEILSIWTTVAAGYGVSWITQPISFFPALGVCGTYIAFLAGSIADVRMPVISMAQKVTKLESGTPEGDVMAAIAVSTSSFVTFTLLTIFTIIGDRIIPFLPKFVTSAFAYIIPAIFSAVFVNMAIKNLKLSIPILIITFVTTIGLPMIGVSASLITLVAIALSIVFARVMFVREKNKKDKNNFLPNEKYS